MASERQIAANRRNANKSSGPRSAAGKKRASGNAYRHGLFSRQARAAVADEIEAFARKIVGRTSGAIALEHARTVAQAENELALIRHAKRALIDRTDIFGDFKTPPRDPPDPLEDLWMMIAQGPQFEAEDVLLTMQQEEIERSMAIKRVLLELENLSLYEKRAAARRDRTIRKLIKLKPMLESPSKSETISKV